MFGVKYKKNEYTCVFILLLNLVILKSSFMMFSSKGKIVITKIFVHLIQNELFEGCPFFHKHNLFVNQDLDENKRHLSRSEAECSAQKTQIAQNQEEITALNELNKPRGVMAKYAKLTEFENGKSGCVCLYDGVDIKIFFFVFEEILGPNKEPTNLDTEFKEAEEFLSEDQISLIRSIVVDDSIKIGIPDTIRPTLRSLGLISNNELATASSMIESVMNTDDDLTSDDDGADESDSEFDNEDFAGQIV